MSPSAELEMLAAVVHGAVAMAHCAGAHVGPLPHHVRGALYVLHGLSIIYNARRGNAGDVLAHVVGVIATSTGRRTLHVGAAAYDIASMIQHARDCA